MFINSQSLVFIDFLILNLASHYLHYYITLRSRSISFLRLYVESFVLSLMTDYIILIYTTDIINTLGVAGQRKKKEKRKNKKEKRVFSAKNHYSGFLLSLT